MSNPNEPEDDSRLHSHLSDVYKRSPEYNQYRYNMEDSNNENNGEDIVVNREGDGKQEQLHEWLVQHDPLWRLLTKWILSILLLLFLTFITFGILYSGIRFQSPSESECATPFGTILGSHNDVVGFSNCNEDYVSLTSNYLKDDPDSPSSFSGMKWQCVEYARRYWMLAGKPEPAFFGDIDSASDIWDLKYAYAVADTSKTFPLLRFSQTRGEGYSSFPRVRDIIIYQKEMPDFPAGHVAVIVGVTFNSTHRLVYVAEQNWDSKQWVSPYYNYTRTIPFMHGDDGKGYYTLNDTSGHILGWMRYE